MSSGAVKGHFLTVELWTSEVSASRTRISTVPKNPFRVIFCETRADLSAPPSRLISKSWCTVISLPHLILVAMREERDVQLQYLAVVAHDVAVLSCKLRRQRVRADADLPQVVKRLVVQFEADPRLQTGGLECRKSCKITLRRSIYLEAGLKESKRS